MEDNDAITLEIKVVVPQIIPSKSLLTTVINLTYSPRLLHKYSVETHKSIFQAKFHVLETQLYFIYLLYVL